MRPCYDAVLVLGKELRRDPERARAELRARAAAASAWMRAGAERVFTLEAHLRGQADSGSAIVVSLLRDLGVGGERVVARDWTRSTREEAVRGAAILREFGVRRAVVVTAAYHVARARRHFAEADAQAEVHAPEAAWRIANDLERGWILAGAPGACALASERRAELLLGTLAHALRPLPRDLRARVEIAAGAALRG